MTSQEYTMEEVREMFLERIWDYIYYWDKIEKETCREKLEGLAFGILVILDGGTRLPGFIVAPCPHPDDKEYSEDIGENWFPQNQKPNVACDIAGSLHELFHNIGRKR